jgi:RNA polymerase sigma-70 factor (ECF subfamily)
MVGVGGSPFFGCLMERFFEQPTTLNRMELKAPATIRDAETLERVIAHRDKFLRFLTSRVEDAATAEDILQAAYVKALEHGSEIRDEESIVAWFYRILRNAVIDHYRKRSAKARAHEGFLAESSEVYEPEFRNTVCQCISDVLDDLKPEYRDVIATVDLRETPVEAFAKSKSISANNASVRLHRARKSIAKQLTTVCGSCAEHKCLDCTCRRSQV